MSPAEAAIRRRNPDETRQKILEAAFHEMHEQGFRGASLDNILRSTGVTKGALYHHFPNKTELGYAVVDEVIWPFGKERWGRVMDPDENPLDMQVKILREESEGSYCQMASRHGCPINNLIQEMASLDDGFRKRLSRILDGWRRAIATALKNGQARGLVRADVNADGAAAMIVASFEGCSSLAKCDQNPALFQQCISGLIDYVESLRP